MKDSSQLLSLAETASPWRALVLLSVAELLGMALWFSASAVVPALKLEWGLDNTSVAWLTLAVQFGFVTGTFLSALFNLPDLINARHLFALCAVAGALSNALFALFVQSVGPGILLRFLTGLFLAGVYPPGMKIMAMWFRQGRGMAIGVLVGALTVGKASPYLINSLNLPSWRHNVLLVSVLAVGGALIVRCLVSDGPYATPNAKFDLHQIKQVFTNRSIRLANFGYFGHMWELYAMWTWAPAMLRASFAQTGGAATLAEVASFLVLGAGGMGCVIAGWLADRVGRTVVTSWAMILSGGCCLIIGFFFEGNPWLLLIVAMIWGASVVADSAQFSTCVTELANPQYIGTALTLQTCIGFFITTLSIELIPILVNHVGWRYAFVALAPGPAFGVISMLRLRMLPEATKIAGGRR